MIGRRHQFFHIVPAHLTRFTLRDPRIEDTTELDISSHLIDLAESVLIVSCPRRGLWVE